MSGDTRWHKYPLFYRTQIVVIEDISRLYSDTKFGCEILDDPKEELVVSPPRQVLPLYFEFPEENHTDNKNGNGWYLPKNILLLSLGHTMVNLPRSIGQGPVVPLVSVHLLLQVLHHAFHPQNRLEGRVMVKAGWSPHLLIRGLTSR